MTESQPEPALWRHGASERPLVGIGGWLAFLAISLTFLGPIGAAILCYSEWQVALAEPVLVLLVAAELAVIAFRTAFGIAAGVALWRLWPRAVALTQAYFVFAIVSAWGLALGLPYLVPGDDLRAAVRTGGLPDAVWATVISAVWLAYLHRSRRVRDTYLTP